MPRLKIHQNKISDPQAVIKICPFGALELKENGEVDINAACKLCKICVKKGPEGAFEFIEDEKPSINKDEWQDITVYVEHSKGSIHPVTYELLGKANELAEKTDQNVNALYIGSNIEENASQIHHYGAQKVYIYDYEELQHFRIEPYAACFEDYIKKYKPSTILVGGTTIGRSLAPRVAARFHTGLTADCTVLDIQDNTDLDQIRPAFGGNIMAHIHTPHNRPQMATVRYKIFDALEGCELSDENEIVQCNIDPSKLTSQIEVKKVKPKKKGKTLEDADTIVVAGRGVKKEEDLSLIRNLASVLDAQMAGTRPLIEAGWISPLKQIGLSGRTVKPKLIITCGVSGSIQFRAGMQNSDTIIAINTDESANIFDVAHIGIVGDLYKVIPSFIEQVKSYKPALCE